MTGRAAARGMSWARANPVPAAHSPVQPASRAARKPPNDLAIGLILTSLLWLPGARAQGAPPNLAKLVAHRESATDAERNQYAYRQTLSLEELDERGILRGQYREVRDIIFSPQQERTEKLVGKPEKGLNSLRLTDEDFRDFRDIQPLALTEDRSEEHTSELQ